MLYSKSLSFLLAALVGNGVFGQDQTIVEIVADSEIHTTLLAAVNAAPPAIAEALGSNDLSLTLFAPDDTAFGNLIGVVGEDYVNDLLTEPWSDHLTCLLFSHVIEGVVFSANITDEAEVPTLYPEYSVTVNRTSEGVTVDGNLVTGADILATNGIIHSISSLPILPPCVSVSIYGLGSMLSDYSTLISLVDAANLTEPLSTARPLTLFAPDNAAFDAVPQYVLDYLSSNTTALTQVLLYHVVPDNVVVPSDYNESLTTLQGESVDVLIVNATGVSSVNDVPISATNILVSNGVIHPIGGVLLPPSLMIPMPTDAPTMMPTMMPTMGPTEPTTAMPTAEETEEPTETPVAPPSGAPSLAVLFVSSLLAAPMLALFF